MMGSGADPAGQAGRPGHLGSLLQVHVVTIFISYKVQTTIDNGPVTFTKNHGARTGSTEPSCYCEHVKLLL